MEAVTFVTASMIFILLPKRQNHLGDRGQLEISNSVSISFCPALAGGMEHWIQVGVVNGNTGVIASVHGFIFHRIVVGNTAQSSSDLLR